MNDAWIGVIGTLAGTLVGGIIAALVSLREQQRAPRLQMLEKKIAAYGLLYGNVFALAASLQNGVAFPEQFDRFKEALVGNMLYLDNATREKVNPLYTYFVSLKDIRDYDPETVSNLIQEASKQLANGIGMAF